MKTDFIKLKKKLKIMHKSKQKYVNELREVVVVLLRTIENAYFSEKILTRYSTVNKRRTI